jgi:protein-S-isoprenylcysteine O-methyltransferase Ste14
MPLTASKLRRHQLHDALVYWLYIPGLVMGGGWLLDRLAALPAIPRSGWLMAVALLLLASGIILIQKATSDLANFGGGTPNPKAPAQSLVTEGCYSLCRHPMFLGYDLASLGVVLLCRSWGMTAVTWPVMILLQVRFLLGEERILARRFGADWEAYRRRVPFLIPRPCRCRETA